MMDENRTYKSILARISSVPKDSILIESLEEILKYGETFHKMKKDSGPLSSLEREKLEDLSRNDVFLALDIDSLDDEMFVTCMLNVLAKYKMLGDNTASAYKMLPENLIDFASSMSTELALLLFIDCDCENLLSNHISALTPSEQQSFLTLAALTGSSNVFFHMTNEMGIEPDATTTTVTFLAQDSQFSERALSNNKSIHLESAALLTAHALNKQSLELLLSRYDESLTRPIAKGDINLISASFSDKDISQATIDKRDDYVQRVIEIKDDKISYVDAFSALTHPGGAKLLGMFHESAGSEEKAKLENLGYHHAELEFMEENAEAAEASLPLMPARGR